jgi:transcriptional regulator with XRE-family HTH domain
MYNSLETSTRIKKLAKEKGVPMSELQEMCGLNKNAVAQAGKSQEGMKAKNLYAIAELLECSVDYLLGRTDNPNETGISVTDNNQMSLTGNNSISINTSRNNSTSDSSDDKQLFDMIKSLDLVERSKIITQIDEMKNKK